MAASNTTEPSAAELTAHVEKTITCHTGDTGLDQTLEYFGHMLEGCDRSERHLQFREDVPYDSLDGILQRHLQRFALEVMEVTEAKKTKATGDAKATKKATKKAKTTANAPPAAPQPAAASAEYNPALQPTWSGNDTYTAADLGIIVGATATAADGTVTG